VEGGLGRGETRNATRSLCDVVCDDGENGPGRRIGSHTRRPSGSWCGRRAPTGTPRRLSTGTRSCPAATYPSVVGCLLSSKSLAVSGRANRSIVQSAST
jgi:hypothetical protein